MNVATQAGHPLCRYHDAHAELKRASQLARCGGKEQEAHELEQDAVRILLNSNGGTMLPSPPTASLQDID